MRNHQAVIDTANGTINFPHVEMTFAMTDEMKNCKPKSLQIMAEGNQPNAVAPTDNNRKRCSNHHQHERRHRCDTATTTI